MRFRKAYGGSRAFDAELRAARPQADPGFLEHARAVVEDAPRRRPERSRARVALAGATTLGMLVAIASVGGIGHAASAVQGVTRVVERAFTPQGPQTPRTVNAGGDQYRPGFGFGDPNHNHTGPPGLEKKGGDLAPPAVPRRKGNSLTVASSITIDEQAVLHISVVDEDGKAVLISQEGSTVGGEALSGPPAKTLRFTVLVPRAIDVRLVIPIGPNQEPGRYSVRFVAVDVEGNRASVDVPFRLPETLQVTGTSGSDKIAPSKTSDVVKTGAGDDVINTGAGDDVVNSGTGNDVVRAPKGNNRINLGAGNDRVVAGSGRDRVVAGKGRDVVSTGRGNDYIDSRDRQRDLVNAGPGTDTCVADSVDILISCEIVRIR